MMRHTALKFASCVQKNNAQVIKNVAAVQTKNYAIVSAEQHFARENDSRLQFIRNCVARLLTLSENERAVSRDLEMLTSLITNKQELVEVLQISAQTGGRLSNLGYENVGFMPKKETAIVTVTGAAGAIGYSLLPRLISGETFGPEQPIILHLVERPEALKALEGVVMELQDCAFPLLRGIKITSDFEEGFTNADYAILVGAKPRGPGMERGDLLKDNGAIFRDVGKAIDRKAKKSILTLVVGNPANTNALVTASNAKNVDPRQFSALTRLDHDRALAQIALKLNVPVSSLKNVAIWGNHSATQVPDLTFATVEGKNVKDLITDKAWIKDVFIPEVQKRGAAIINARGASSAASAADAAVKHMRDWTQGSNGQWVSMAVHTDGSAYNVPKGIYSSFPVVCSGEGKYEVVKDLTLDADIKSRLDKSVKELQEEKAAVKNLL